MARTDNTVLRIGRTYEVRGMVEKITSYDNATVGSGSIVNEVKLEYNDFGQLKKESQAHAGAVSSSPNVQYAYANGGSSSNQIRPTSLTYPDSRVIDSNYGTGSGLNDFLNRVEALKDGSTALAAYTYIGSGTVIVIDYAQAQVKLDLWGGTTGVFDGFDRFNRIIDQRWKYYGGSPADLDRYKYGYDRDSNRIWKQNTVGSSLDEYYTYDSLNRLTSMQRGTLTGTPPSGISGTPVKKEDWTLDPTGNWKGYTQKTSGTTDLDQARSANPVNEISNISQSAGPAWVTPSYDEAGNTISFPQGDDPTLAYSASYDAWNRMVEVKDDGGNSVARYKYDGRMRRIIQESYTAGSLSETRHFYFTNDWRDIEERVGSSSSADLQYVWGLRYVDELVCRDDATPRRLYAMQDANFNLTAICDTSGAVVERYVFTPYGVRSIRNAAWGVISASAYGWVVGHQGLRQQQGVGVIYVRDRLLHNYLGEYLQRDRLEYAANLNLFVYLNGNPGNATDPLGLLPSELDAGTGGSWYDDICGPYSSNENLRGIQRWHYLEWQAWFEKQEAALLAALTALCASCIGQGGRPVQCCTAADCKEQAGILAHQIVKDILKTILNINPAGGWTGDVCGDIDCGGWQQVILDSAMNVNSAYSGRGHACFSIQTVDAVNPLSGILKDTIWQRQHSWIELTCRSGAGRVVIDPWKSGGFDDILDTSHTTGWKKVKRLPIIEKYAIPCPKASAPRTSGGPTTKPLQL